MNANDINNYLVTIRCMTYNHKPYIQQCLDGFVMQKTNFPFVAIVVDDASTDNEPEILWTFINHELDLSSSLKEETVDYVRIVAPHKTNNKCTFVFIFLKYNHHSIKKDKLQYCKKWISSSKYIALCEGDDYWTDSLKLQKQVDFLDAHPDFTMVCNRTKLYSEKKKRFVGENHCYNKSQIVNPKDVIYRTGLFISTCSIMHRKNITDDKPEYWAKCKVGDYPLQIMCAMKGKVFYFNDIMSVYRVENSNSWMGQQKWGTMDKGRLEVIESQINMFKGFAQDFPQYKKWFKRKIANHINRNVPGQPSIQEKFLSYFTQDIKKYTPSQKFELWLIRKLQNRKLKYYYFRIFQSQYFQHIKAY